jgi:hypothetical protein
LKKLLFIPVVVLSLGAFLHLPTGAEEKTVSATITPLQVSMSLSKNTIDYGVKTQGVGEIEPTPNTAIVVSNTGSVPERFLIRGGDSVSGDWLLDTAAGQDRFVHRFSTSSTGTFTDMTTADKIVISNVSNVSPNNTFDLYLRLVVPSVITKTAVQTLPVYITAIQQPQ